MYKDKLRQSFLIKNQGSLSPVISTTDPFCVPSNTGLLTNLAQPLAKTQPSCGLMSVFNKWPTPFSPWANGTLLMTTLIRSAHKELNRCHQMNRPNCTRCEAKNRLRPRTKQTCFCKTQLKGQKFESGQIIFVKHTAKKLPTSTDVRHVSIQCFAKLPPVDFLM